MSNCKTCGNHFPLSIKIDDLVRSLKGRKNCLDCVPFRQKKGSKRQSILLVCTICSKQYSYRSGNGGNKTICYNCCAYQRRMNLKIRMVNYKGAKCEKCNYSKCIKALQFHHIDRTKKEIALSACLANNHSWSRIQEELDKCQLLCANCHIEIEAEIFISSKEA